MDYRGLSVIGVWGGTISLSALFLYFDFTADFILAMVVFALILTVYIVRLKPGGDIDEEITKITTSLEDLGNRLSSIEKNVNEINKLLED